MLFSTQSKFQQVEQSLKGLKLVNYQPLWEEFMKKYKCNYICELGIYKGENFTNMIAHKPSLAVAVQERKDLDIYFKDQVYGLPFVKILNEDTAEAAKHFRNNYFDFVYVDANTSTESCYRNLTSWYPKVRYGKFLVGHNYRKGNNVAEAVDRFVKEKKLKMMWRTPSIWGVIKT